MFTFSICTVEVTLMWLQEEMKVPWRELSLKTTFSSKAEVDCFSNFPKN